MLSGLDHLGLIVEMDDGDDGMSDGDGGMNDGETFGLTVAEDTEN